MATAPPELDAKKDVIGQIVRVQLTDGRLYVGRLECVDKEKTLYINSGCEIIDTEADSFQEYSVFQKYAGSKTAGRYHYKPVGSLIVPGKAFAKIWLDRTISAAVQPIEEEVVKKDEVKQQTEEKVQEKASQP